MVADFAAFDSSICCDVDYDLRELPSFDVVLIDFEVLHQESMMRDIAADPVIAAEFDLEKGHRKALDFVDGGPLNVQWLQLNS